jgi:Glycosyltransferase sugar-binding region containing DXD motif
MTPLDLILMKIPKILWQTSQYEWSNIPDWLKLYVDTWQQHNPAWEYRYQSNLEFYRYLEKTYSYDLAKNFYNLPGYFKGDFWRFYVLGGVGGVYADIDTICYSAIDQLIDSLVDFTDASPTVSTGNSNWYNNWLIVSSGTSDIINYAKNRCISSLSGGEPMSVDIWQEAVTNSVSAKFLPLHPEIVKLDDNTPVCMHLAGSVNWNDIKPDTKLIEKSFWNLPKNTRVSQRAGIK